MRTWFTTFTLLTMLALCVSAAYCCVGARPLAMGGAFIALADDANATYWNPAGLAQMPPGQMLGTWTHTAENRDLVNYQEYASLVNSFRSSRFVKKIAVGGSYIASDTTVMLGFTPLLDEQQWYWGSLAVDTGSLGMFGVNVRKVNNSISGHSADSDWAIDAGYLCRLSPSLTAGILAQDLNEPETRIDDTSFSNALNWRAGLAFRPNKSTVITVDGYDLADNCGLQSARVGAEKVFSNFILRAGYYGLLSDAEQGMTFGLGISKELYDIDAALLMGDFDNTIMVSASFNLL